MVKKNKHFSPRLATVSTIHSISILKPPPATKAHYPIIEFYFTFTHEENSISLIPFYIISLSKKIHLIKITKNKNYIRNIFRFISYKLLQSHIKLF